MNTEKSRVVAVLPGDGIGEEVTTEAVRIIEKLNAAQDLGIECKHAPVGGTAYDCLLYTSPSPRDRG